MYKVRPHHGICIQLFKGKGYSEEFVANMKEFIEILESNPQIQLFPECDELCKSCPHKLLTNECNTKNHVLKLDNNVLSHLNLEAYQVMFWEDFKNKVKKEILDNNQLENICKGCSWLSFCLENNT